MPAPIVDSSVLSATVTGFFAFAGVIGTLYLSRRKSGGKKSKKPFYSNGNDPMNYAGYEALLKEINATNSESHRLKDMEIHRLNERDTARDLLIDTLRDKETELYKIIEAKNQEITTLRHLREYNDAARAVPRATMENNTRAQSDAKNNSV